MKTEQTARIHRHGYKVAFDTESMDKTIYFSPFMAKEIAKELLEYAEDCDENYFSDSPLGTKDLTDS